MNLGMDKEVAFVVGIQAESVARVVVLWENISVGFPLEKRLRYAGK